MCRRFVLLVAVCLFISAIDADHTGGGKKSGKGRPPKKEGRKDAFLKKVLQQYRDALLMCIHPHNFVCTIDPKNKKADLMCIPLEWRCDGRVDCPGGEDEDECTPEVCEAEQVRCCDTEKCADVCDGRSECTWGEDELNCEGEDLDCESLKCPEGTCAYACDGRVECEGGEDERNCNTGTGCLPHEFVCPVPAGANVTCAIACDGRSECVEGTDEANCFSRICPTDRTPCEAIDSLAEICAPLCNDIIECSDGRDEQFEFCKRCVLCESTSPPDQCVFEDECP